MYQEPKVKTQQSYQRVRQASGPTKDNTRSIVTPLQYVCTTPQGRSKLRASVHREHEADGDDNPWH